MSRTSAEMQDGRVSHHRVCDAYSFQSVYLTNRDEVLNGKTRDTNSKCVSS
jgi:hypothetical protein